MNVDMIATIRYLIIDSEQTKIMHAKKYWTEKNDKYWSGEKREDEMVRRIEMGNGWRT